MPGNATHTAGLAYDFFGINKSLFLLINQVHAPIFDQVMLVVTNLGHPAWYPPYLALALLLAWQRPAVLPQRNVVVFAVSYVLNSMIIVPAIKTALDFPRPVTVFGEGGVTILGTPDVIHSFPSGHAAFAVLMATSLAPGMPRTGRLLLLGFALLVCISRVSVGAHFPADVIAGAGIGMFVVWGVRSLCPR